MLNLEQIKEFIRWLIHGDQPQPIRIKTEEEARRRRDDRY